MDTVDVLPCTIIQINLHNAYRKCSVNGLSVSDVVARTGVGESTLRMWERRHGLPVPDRLPNGHRRYSEDELELVRWVVAARAAGLSLHAAIERARQQGAAPAASLYAGLRRRRPDIEPRTISRPILAALSHAIEDESLSRAERAILFASFQRAASYRREQARWRRLAQGAQLTVVFADFRRLRLDDDRPAELPIDRDHPVAREWAIVCDADRHAVCLVGREPPSSSVGMPAAQRVFEVLWSVEPRVVREAARICAEIAAATAPELVAPIEDQLAGEAAAAADDQLQLATAVTNRALSYIP
jgi:MerR family transcriptional regulator, light-induced transcriptional regulator